jgi:hypothetical protein
MEENESKEVDGTGDVRVDRHARPCNHAWEPCEDRSGDEPRFGRGCRKCDAFEENAESLANRHFDIEWVNGMDA